MTPETSFDSWKKLRLGEIDHDNPFLTLLHTSLRREQDKYLQKIFCLSVDPLNKPGIVYLPTETPDGLWSLNFLGLLLSKRLDMSKSQLINSLIVPEDELIQALETRPIIYLSTCYLKCYETFQNVVSCGSTISKEVLCTMKKAIVSKTAHVFQKHLHENTAKHVWQLLMEYHDNASMIALSQWMEDTYLELSSKGMASVLKKLIDQILNRAQKEIKETPLLSLHEDLFHVVKYFVKTPQLSLLFMGKQLEGVNVDGSSYMETLIGTILRKSCFADVGEQFEHFKGETSRMTQADIQITTSKIHYCLDLVQETIADVFMSLFKVNDQTKHLALLWIGRCLHANKSKNSLSASAFKNASEGFLINLSSVLLRLSLPLSKKKNIFRVDPTYNAKKFKPAQWEVHIHLIEADKATTLLPKGDDPIDCLEVYNFISDIFFLTHKSMDLWLKPVQDMYAKVTKDCDVRAKEFNKNLKSNQLSLEILNNMRSNLDRVMMAYYCIRSSLLVPSFVNNAMSFNASSCSLLVQLQLNPDEFKAASMRDLVFPCTHTVPKGLTCMPEFVVQNICEFLNLVGVNCSKSFEENGSSLSLFFEFILVYMGSPGLIKNPHLRAKLARSLVDIMPIHLWSFDGSFQRTQLFLNHPHRLEIIPTLLKVFVDIEAKSHHATDADVGDGMKYSYRAPVYNVLLYLLESEEYIEKLCAVAKDAEDNIDADDPPLFLKFVNYLINDGIFLVDESLDMMGRLQEEEGQLEGQALLHELQERAVSLQRLAGWARACNRMSHLSLKLWNVLSRHVKPVFTHDTVKGRVAEMLNHFLKSMVDFKTKSGKYFFDVFSYIC